MKGVRVKQKLLAGLLHPSIFIFCVYALGYRLGLDYQVVEKTTDCVIPSAARNLALFFKAFEVGLVEHALGMARPVLPGSAESRFSETLRFVARFW